MANECSLNQETIAEDKILPSYVNTEMVMDSTSIGRDTNYSANSGKLQNQRTGSDSLLSGDNDGVKKVKDSGSNVEGMASAKEASHSPDRKARYPLQMQISKYLFSFK